MINKITISGVASYKNDDEDFLCIMKTMYGTR